MCNKVDMSESPALIINSVKILSGPGAEFFFNLAMEQLKKLCGEENFIKLVQKQQEKTKEPGLTDIVQGSRYKETMAQATDEGLNLTLTMNTDGVALFSSSKKGSLWPVYIAVNELPVKLRYSRKYLIPCYLHCQTEKPNMVTYLQPMMTTLNELNEKGMQVDTSKGVILVRAKLLIVSVDLPARAIVSNMKQFNGKSSCSVCLDEGTSRPGQPMLRYYPFNKDSVIRTHQSMVNDASRAVEEVNAVNGIKGASSLMMLKYLDLPKALAIDWMHSVLLGVTKTLMKLWFDAKNKDKSFYIGNQIALLDKRFLKIQIPDFVSRRQRTIADHAHWKASECREWLIHFSVPLLYKVLKSEVYVHYLLFVTGVTTLVRDDLSVEDVVIAESLLNKFCMVYPKIYGDVSQTMNVHLIRHLAYFVRMYGPLFGYSCFGFESMNSFIKQMVHGTSHINKQVSFAVSMSKALSGIVKNLQEHVDDVKTKQLFAKLGSKIVQEEKTLQKGCTALGRKAQLKNNHRYYELLAEHMKEQSPNLFWRLSLDGNTYYSKDYQNAKTRSDYIASYAYRNEEGKGIILSFLEAGELYAIVKELITVNFSLDVQIQRDIKNEILKEQLDVCFCKHLQRIERYGDIKIIPAVCMKKKCILIDINEQLSFISCPPNTLEHN